MRHRILILGGTFEARALAATISAWRDLDITMSLAGRTTKPLAQTVPTRTGGFGGMTGLVDYLVKTKTDILIDATHPFAANISANAIGAAQLAHVKHFTISRPPWRPVRGDLWCAAPSVNDAIAMAGADALRIFVALGRQELTPLHAAPLHHYVIRSIEPVSPLIQAALPNATYILGRGPFREARETLLLLDADIDLIIAKNSGGPAAYAKLIAARELAIPVILIDRPPGCR